MRRVIQNAVCLLAVVGLAACSAMRPSNNQPAEQYIHDSEAAWAESVSSNDASVLKRIMADDCVWVLDGVVWTKAQAIADAEAGPGDFVSDHLDEVHIRFFGDTAVAQGSETWERKKDGNSRHGRFVWTDTWVRRNGIWQIVQAEDITVPAAPAQAAEK